MTAGGVSESRVRVGRTAALIAVVLSVGGWVTALTVAGLEDAGLDRIIEDFVPQLAAIGTGFGLLAWHVLPRDPGNRVVWVYALVSVLAGVYVTAEAAAVAGLRAEGLPITGEAIDALRPTDLNFVVAAAVMIGAIVISPGIFWLLSLGIVMFPDGRLPSRRWRWVVWLAVASGLVTGVILGWLEQPASDVTYGSVESDYDTWISAPLIGLVAATVFSFVGLLVRFRRSIGVERQQIRWVLFGTSLVVPALAAAVILSGTGKELGLSILVLAALLVYMGCFWVALTRYRLYDIDIVISRSIVFGVLAAFITAVYALVVVGIGSWIGAGTSSLALSIAATAIVAVVFEPVRERIQRIANKIVYGAKATPYQVLADLTARLASAESTEGLLERMVQRLAEGTGASKAVVRLTGEEGGPTAVWPPDAADSPDDGAFTVPITASDVELGSVSIVKARGESLTPTEQALVEDLAGSAGMVLTKVRLDADLEARAEELRVSRRRLVDAQAEERRRLERDLHDGAQQQVVALKVKLGLAQRLAEQEGSEQAAAMIEQMAADAQSTIDEIRSLGKGIFPPLLESDGLRAAVSAGAANAPLPVVVDASDLGRYDSELEAAAYFCITEAITNAIKYSGSDRIDVHLRTVDGGLEFVVADRGEGFEMTEHRSGTGLVGMRDRLEALGGRLRVASSPGSGTRVEGFLPGAVHD